MPRLLSVKDTFATTLTTNITSSGQNTMGLGTDPALPYPYELTIGSQAEMDAGNSEVVKITGKTGSDFAIERGKCGTTAKSYWPAGTMVRLQITSDIIKEVQRWPTTPWTSIADYDQIQVGPRAIIGSNFKTIAGQPTTDPELCITNNYHWDGTYDRRIAAQPVTSMVFSGSGNFAIYLVPTGAAWSTFNAEDYSRFRMTNAGRIMLGVGRDPTAFLELRAGESGAWGAPLKFKSGSLMSTPEAGALEMNSGILYYTPSTTRKRVAVSQNAGVSGSFTTTDGKTITVQDGVVTGIA